MTIISSQIEHIIINKLVVTRKFIEPRKRTEDKMNFNNGTMSGNYHKMSCYMDENCFAIITNEKEMRLSYLEETLSGHKAIVCSLTNKLKQ